MSSINIAYEKLHQCLCSCRSLVENDKSGILLLQCINESIQRLEQPMQLAIIGKISTSKSTLVNSILGQKDIVATNGKELTYNVNWLIHGNENSDIEIIFKDGSKAYRPQSEWKRLSNRPNSEDTELLDYMNKIKYIRVPYACDMLKDINIIDTPGLFSVYGTDSQNTIDFLSEVKPDAVVVLFTKSISSEDVAALSNFQKGKGKTLFSLSPLNAVGIMAKMDEFWKARTAEEAPYDIAERVICNIKNDYPVLQQHLFSVLPLSALLGVGATTIATYLPLFRRLAQNSFDLLCDKLKSVLHFEKKCEDFGISKDECTALVENYGLYGIYTIVAYLRKNISATSAEVASHLKKVSGFDRFMQLLLSHFRDRASLIKVQSSVQIIAEMCEQVINESSDEQSIQKAEQIQEQVLSALMSVHEYKEWSYLYKIYSGEYKQTNKDMIEEYKTVCGEYGNCAIKKLNMPDESSVAEMQQKASERSKYWNKQYMVSRIRSPKEAELCKVMSESYNVLRNRIEEMATKKEEALKTLELVNSFLYGK